MLGDRAADDTRLVRGFRKQHGLAGDEVVAVDGCDLLALALPLLRAGVRYADRPKKVAALNLFAVEDADRVRVVESLCQLSVRLLAEVVEVVEKLTLLLGGETQVTVTSTVKCDRARSSTAIQISSRAWDAGPCSASSSSTKILPRRL